MKLKKKNEVTCSDVGELNPWLIVSMPTMASLVEGDALPGSLQNKDYKMLPSN